MRHNHLTPEELVREMHRRYRQVILLTEDMVILQTFGDLFGEKLKSNDVKESDFTNDIR